MTDLAGDKPSARRVFSFLQEGRRLHRIAVSPAFFFALVALTGLLLAGALARTALALFHKNPSAALSGGDPQVTSLRVSRSHPEAERPTSRDLATFDLLGARVRVMSERQAELEAQTLTLEPLDADPPATVASPPDESAEPPQIRLKKLDGAMNGPGARKAPALASLAHTR